MFLEWAHAVIVEHFVSFFNGAVNRWSVIIRNITAVVSDTDVHVFVFDTSFVTRPRFRVPLPPPPTSTHTHTQCNVYHYCFHHYHQTTGAVKQVLVVGLVVFLSLDTLNHLRALLYTRRVCVCSFLIRFYFLYATVCVCVCRV